MLRRIRLLSILYRINQLGMKRLIIFTFASLIFVFGAHAQNIDEMNINIYLAWAQALVNEADGIEKIEQEISSLEETCDSLRTSWSQTCKEYLDSPKTKYIEDLDYLIENTDPAFDGQELYDRLVTARNNAVEYRHKNQDSPESPIKENSGGYLDDRVLRSLR